jgi:hypothetical protein
MKRAIVNFVDGGFCNLEADYMDADDKFVSIHLGDKIVGIFQLEYVKAAYLSEKTEVK